MTATFALGIPHTPWNVERVASLSRLVDALSPSPPALVDRRVFGEREPNWAWSERMWRWALESRATHLLQIQDDVIVGPEFWDHLTAMVRAVPDEIIGLESVLAMGSPWYTTTDCLVGVGYVMPTRCARRSADHASLEELLEFRGELRGAEPHEGFKRINEDQLIGLYSFVRGTRIWHPCPTIIDHDTDLKSTYGNDAHTHRRPARSTVRGDAAPESWSVPGEVAHAGMFYRATPALCRQHVRGYSFERYRRDCA